MSGDGHPTAREAWMLDESRPTMPSVSALLDEVEELRLRLDLLKKAAPDLLFVHDGGRLLDVGGPVAQVLGFTEAEMCGQPVLGPWLDPEAAALVQARIAEGFSGRYQLLLRHKDGSPVPAELSVSRVERDGRQLRAVVVHDLRRQLAAEARLAEEDARFRALMDVAYDGMVVHRGGYVIDTNEGFARMCGYTVDEVLGMMPSAVVTPESVAIIAQKIRADDTDPYEVVGVRKNGEHFPMLIQGRRVPGDRDLRITGFKDLTRQRAAEAEREALQAQLLQAQKLEGLGVMAGGIAHDFNNLLAVMIGSAELATLHTPEAHPARKHLDALLDAAGRASGLTRQMLAYAGQMPTEPEALDLSALVGETLHLLRVVLPPGADFSTDLAAGPVRVRADPGQLGQVAMNLITNAAEALPEGRGRVRLKVARVPSAAPWKRHLVAGGKTAPGPHVLLEVCDDGSGMDADTRSRIFDPFFTTRFQGRGLGLPTVLGIVRAHGGALAVESTLGEGSCFSVLLPALGDMPLPAVRAQAPPPCLRGRVLIVDDEPLVGRVTQHLLEALGAHVEVVPSGEALLDRLTEGPIPDVVVLDRLMPGMGGDMALRRLRSRWPVLPVLVYSGREAHGDLAEGDRHTRFLAKPATRNGLLRALGALMQPSPEPPVTS